MVTMRFSLHRVCGLVVVMCLFVGLAHAEDDTQFGFDLFSDIAPILALFGEQFATQFISESLNWLDHLIFALVPLGILTVITGAIRVSGPQVAKSFIGRARENRALAEIELMSSTSNEVCELFNGRGLVRAMGKPKIAEFLVFPIEYDQLATKNEDTDKKWRDAKGPHSFEADKDPSCGIHSLESAKDAKGRDGRQPLMEYGDYHSRSYLVATKWWDKLIDILDAFHLTTALSRAYSAVLRLLGSIEKIVFSPRRVRESKVGSTGSAVNLLQSQTMESSAAPPNLQLNLSSDHFTKSHIKKGHELFLAAGIAVILQTGLFTIAAITVYHEPTRDALGSVHKPWGLPCYIAGSVLLSVGIGICARSVERSTVEKCYRLPGKWLSGYTTDEELASCPRLLWLQQDQTVSDQAFDGYVILAGPKRRVVTSRRIEDPGTLSQGDAIAANLSREPDMEAPSSTASNLWKGLTVLGVAASGLGFIAQFFGLRGLPFPCSVAQLAAILIMALVRSGIRRRLGRIPAHCTALSNYELDGLAIHIAFTPKFRTFSRFSARNEFFAGNIPVGHFYRWEIAAPEDVKGNKSFYFVLPSDPPTKSEERTVTEEIEAVDRREPVVEAEEFAKGKGAEVKEVSEGEEVAEPSKKPEFRSPRFAPASSQQLLRVRERLANLCLWTSQATETAVSLVQSVELFMETFFPPPGKSIPEKMEPFTKFNWVISTNNPSWSDDSLSKGPDFIVILVQRSGGGKWTVELGKVDAALSLWMATIDTKRLLKKRDIADQPPDKANTGGPVARRPPDWRRIKAATGMKLRFYRVLGTDFKDGVLKRDLSWWVDERFADQDDTDSLDKKSDAVDLVIGFSGRPDTIDARRIVGGDTLKELGVISSAFLPTILAQHLFTSFMWNIAKILPKNCLRSGYTSNQKDVQIEASDSFNPDEFSKTWYRPKLRHSQLINIAQQMETNGLGSMKQILYSMVPALSFHDLLPNHAIIKIMPKVGAGQGWEETAHCYNRLLEEKIRSDGGNEERFCYAVVVAAMDFLYLACEPYAGSISPPSELNKELQGLAEKLASERFVKVVSNLASVYDLQHRRRAFKAIFERYKSGETSILDAFEKKNAELDPEFLRENLGFSDLHYSVVMVMSRDLDRWELLRSWYGPKENGEGLAVPDIFGWTPIHYGFLTQDDWLSGQITSYIRSSREEREELRFHIHKLFDNIGRSPIHIAASAGLRLVLDDVLELFTEEEKKNTFTNGGLDGMTPLHLAVRSGKKEMFEGIFKQALRFRSITVTDAWGREAIHLATSIGNAEMTGILLSNGSHSDLLDDTGKSPVDYLLQSKPGVGEDEEPGSGGTSALIDDTVTNVDGRRNQNPVLDKNRCAILQELARKKLDYRNPAGKTFLHIAAEVADADTIDALKNQVGLNLEAKDLQDRTPLHCAILAGNTAVALALIDNLGSNVSAKDVLGTSTLMLAVSKNLREVVELLFARAKEVEPLAATVESVAEHKRVVLAGCDITEKDRAGRTVLHYAVDIEPADAPDTTQTQMFKLLISKGCDPMMKNGDGEIPLHQAINEGKGEIAVFLLNLDPAQRPSTPRGSGSDNFLINACKAPCTAIIPRLLELWPDIINEGDSYYQQPPLSWALERRYEDIVKMLVKYPELEVNKPARNYNNYTPLHFAAQEGDEKILGYLLQRDEADVEAKNDFADTPVDMAFNCGSLVCTKNLLIHRTASDKQRIVYLERLAAQEHEKFHIILGDVLGKVENESLTDETLTQLLDAAEQLDQPRPLFEVFMSRCLRRDTWKHINNPFHRAAKHESITIIESLTAVGGNPAEPDQDNWSCLDYATRLGLNVGFLSALNGHVKEHKPSDYTKPDPSKPSTLSVPSDLESIVQVSSCSTEHHGGSSCAGFKVVSVLAASESSERACIRADHPIPPPTKDNKYFYFEVTVTAISSSRILGIGFCGPGGGEGQMPGSFEGSWAYHGGDGLLFVEDADIAPSSDFGPSGQFSAEETAGVYLNLETGEAFCTLNGEMMRMGPSFRLKNLTRGKVYPCVGVDITPGGVGLSFQVNFGSSTVHHPFRYQQSGPSPLREERERLTGILNFLENNKRLGPTGSFIPRLRQRIRELEVTIQQIDLEAQIDDYTLSPTEREKTERRLRQAQVETEEMARLVARPF